MKHRILALLLCLLPLAAAHAQSTMSEQQIIQYIQVQHEKGKSNEEIGADLLKRGVTPEQLRKIKQKYEKQGKEGAIDLTGTSTAVSRDESRLRKREPVNQRRSLDQNMTKERRKEYTEQTAMQLQDELAVFAPDSMQMVMNEMYPQEEKKERKVFGRDIFNNEKLSFEPNENAATPGNYVLGPGDDVYIDIWGASQMTYNGTISPDGNIVIEGIGPVTLGGMTVEKANEYLRRQFQDVYAGSNVRITVGQTHTIGVNVMGEVQVPGTYTLSAFATAFHALYAAGGVNDIGTLRSIFIYRKGRKIAEIDVYDYILHGKTVDDIRLETGDVIYVGPYHSLVDIEGKVKRPMFYEMKQSETLATLLGFAGNFAGDAYRQSIRVIRKNGYDYTVHTVEEFDFAAFKMLDGDSVTVDSTISRFSNMVEVRGAVYRPGMYQMDGKAKTVRELLTSIDGPTEKALKGRAVIYRMKDDRSREVKSFNLEALMNGTATDIPLRNEDIIQIFDQETTQTGRTLTIYGSVNYPGIYEYSEGTSIEDLILQAGGLTDDASLQNVEVGRRVMDAKSLHQSSSIAKTFIFSLSEDLSVQGDPSFVLMPYDEVYVRRSPSWADNRVVSVTGEVNFEGSYMLQRKDERLSDIIKRAGGLSEYAYAEGAHLERTMSEDELDRKKALIRLAQSSADSIDQKSLDISNVYTVGINLKAALENPGCTDDIILAAGDKLVVPERPTIVKVNGAVMYPNAVAWQEGKNAKYYIELAGGYSPKAKKSKAFVVYLDGSVRRLKKAKKIEPGCEIVVPVRNDKRRMSISEVATLGTSIASLATMIATIANIVSK
ncbi:MAG: SLBB domain-containing protein [Bacteroidaceae bacterium]|nr:SLBB domain-containing protein [Bacteroidaceae bacterium]